jgi:hypothetical protein
VIEPTIRDDRINQEDRDEYARALLQAATQRQEVTSARESASGGQVSSSDIIRRLDGISETLQTLTTRVARLEARSGGQATATSQPSPSSRTSAPVSTTTPADADEPVSNRTARPDEVAKPAPRSRKVSSQTPERRRTNYNAKDCFPAAARCSLAKAQLLCCAFRPIRGPHWMRQN